MLNKVLADVEDTLDRFYTANYKYFAPKVYDTLRLAGAKASHANAVYAYYAPLASEVKEGEGYERLTPKQRKSYVEFVEAVLAESKRYARNLAAQKPSRKKKISVERQTSKAVYQAECPDLMLVSVDVTKIPGMTELWLYNTKTRILTYLVARDKETFTVRGTTVYGWDETKSYAKRLRKPAEFFKSFMSGTRWSQVKDFEKVTTKPCTRMSSRLNKETIIVKVHK